MMKQLYTQLKSIFYMIYILFTVTFCLRILEQNVGILTSKFGCGSNCKGSMCLVEQEIAFASNVEKAGVFDLIFLAEVMDSRDCTKTHYRENSERQQSSSQKVEKICSCSKYPNQQQIERLVSLNYTKLCDGHRSCVAVHREYGNVTSCYPIGSTCMNGLNYQTLQKCKNPQVPDSGISYVDIFEYESGLEVRVILYHPIAYQGCFVEECFWEYFKAMEKLLEGGKRVVIAGDFNFDTVRLINLVQMDAFWYFNNITKDHGLKFFNTYFPESNYSSTSKLPIPTEVGLFTLDWIGSNFYEFGTCLNLNQMHNRMDYPVLSFDHRGQICELSHKQVTTMPKIGVNTGQQKGRLYRSKKASFSVQDILGGLVEYSEIYLKDVYDSSPIHVKLFDVDFWYNVTETWCSFPFGIPILNQYAISTQTINFWTEELISVINGTIDLYLYNPVFKRISERGTIIANLVVENINICATFCNDDFEPVCFKKNPKKKNPSFCPSNSTCPQKYNVTTPHYMQITNIEVMFDRKKSEIHVEDVTSEIIKKVADFIFGEMKDIVFTEIENSVVDFTKGKVFLIPE